MPRGNLTRTRVQEPGKETYCCYGDPWAVRKILQKDRRFRFCKYLCTWVFDRTGNEPLPQIKGVYLAPDPLPSDWEMTDFYTTGQIGQRARKRSWTESKKLDPESYVIVCNQWQGYQYNPTLKKKCHRWCWTLARPLNKQEIATLAQEIEWEEHQENLLQELRDLTEPDEIYPTLNLEQLLDTSVVYPLEQKLFDSGLAWWVVLEPDGLLIIDQSSAEEHDNVTVGKTKAEGRWIGDRQLRDWAEQVLKVCCVKRYQPIA